MDIFAKATRLKLRFPSNRCQLTVEQLWDMKLSSKDNFDLDTVAKMISRELKDVGEESFVSTKRNPQKNRLQLALDVVKAVISEKMAEERMRSKRSADKLEKARLLEILGDKEREKQMKMTPEELQARIASLTEEEHELDEFE